MDELQIKKIFSDTAYSLNSEGIKIAVRQNPKRS